MDNKLLETLAERQHEIWAHWMKYMFTQCTKEQKMERVENGFFETGNLIIPKEKVERWTRQIETEYKDLTEKEKESDREQALKFKNLF